jgi:thiamine-phosphate pyrophosphorylase
VIDPSLLRLVAITDSLRDGVDGLVGRARQAAQGGATMIHLRLKDETPRVLTEVARALRLAVPDLPIIVNDRGDVALAAGAHGVHLGIDGLAPAALRRVVPEQFMIGISVGAMEDIARTSGADFVGIGPVFGAGGKADVEGVLGLEHFSELARRCALPAVAIGGVTAENIGTLMRAGAAGVAVISALFASADPTGAARVLRSAQDASGR